MVAKFQAVQAAHEILCDPQLKTKYDADRAKLNRVTHNFSAPETDPYNFRKPARPPPPPSQFPPPRRTQTTKDFSTGGAARFAASGGRPNPAAAAASGAEKFKAFTRATPQQWDRAKFDEAARADAARSFQFMKGGRVYPGQQMPPPPPTRPPRAPTAPKPNTFDPTSPNDDQSNLRPGYPGLSRTANMRRSGFDPSSPSPGMDEQHAPNRPSAYASYNRGERPQASNQHGYFPDGNAPQSPPITHKQPAVSPLRHVRSESGWDPPKPQRPDLERVSSKYANTPGEKTNPGGGLGRSSSLRSSPVERNWDEEDGRAHFDRPHSHHGPPRRHQSSSPKLRPSHARRDYSSSSSESSDDEGPNLSSRPKAQPRRPRVQTASTEQHGYRPFSADDPALTGQFPSNNYTKIVNDNSPHYNSPPPGHGPVRRPFSNMASPEDAYPSMNGSSPHPDDGIPKYESLHSSPKDILSQPIRQRPRVFRNYPKSLSRGMPSWQVPSSVMPGLGSPSKWFRMNSIPEERTSTLHHWLSDPPVVSEFELFREPWQADKVSLNSQRRAPPDQMHSPQGASNPHSVSEQNVNSKFSAADWDGKFGSGGEFLRPNIDTSDRDRRSPTRKPRSRARSTGKVKLDAQGHVQENVPHVPNLDGRSYVEETNKTAEAQSGSDGDFQFVDAQEQPKSAAFQPGTFSADEWAEKFKEQKWTTPSGELNSRRPKPQKKSSRSVPRRQDATNSSTEEIIDFGPNFEPGFATTEDAMDIDGPSLVNVPSKLDDKASPLPKPSPVVGANGALNVNLEDLKKTAPFAPSATGLKDLNDLSSTLPFESRPAASVDQALHHTISSTARRLDLPKPPKVIIPPAEDDLTQAAWEIYVQNINTYLHDWNVFNIKMLDHFRTRQDQINVGMRNNWISSVGDGPSVEVFDAAGSSDGLRAGFAAYMAWLEDDARCRSWWDTANERHRECFESVARIREKVKKAAGVV